MAAAVLRLFNEEDNLRDPRDLVDAELVTKALQGDFAASSELQHRHFHVATRIARRISPRGQADEIASQGMIRAYKIYATNPSVAFPTVLQVAIRKVVAA
ncbi:hypothetical protein BH09ACT10_BH09ACT10_10140 [soil metagenome]